MKKVFTLIELIFDTVDSILDVYINLVDLEQKPVNSLKLEDLMSFMDKAKKNFRIR